MRNNFKGILLAAFFISFFCNSIFAQFNPADIPAKELLKGYVKDISGENISYHSFHPYATEALLTRVTDGKKAI